MPIDGNKAEIIITVGACRFRSAFLAEFQRAAKLTGAMEEEESPKESAIASSQGGNPGHREPPRDIRASKWRN